MADGDLSDEQLKQLLKDAERRLTEAKPRQALQAHGSSPQKYIQSSALSSSFLQELSNIVAVFPRLLPASS
jgi:hypothetical protein